tara:strand:- start:62 stop:349 length:288 start_codon:yes stop_codon:yes gene_type:complete
MVVYRSLLILISSSSLFLFGFDQQLTNRLLLLTMAVLLILGLILFPFVGFFSLLYLGFFNNYIKNQLCDELGVRCGYVATIAADQLLISTARFTF